MTIHQFTAAQDWALHELARGLTPSVETHTRTLKSLQRAGLCERDGAGWRLTPAGHREAAKAMERMKRRDM